MTQAKDEMVRLQDVAKAVMGLGLVYWFFWWCFPLWAGFHPVSHRGAGYAWCMYGLALLGPTIFMSATLLYVEWRCRKQRS